MNKYLLLLMFADKRTGEIHNKWEIFNTAETAFLREDHYRKEGNSISYRLGNSVILEVHQVFEKE